jgi:peptidoglycan DL-endopeptidase CwlO
VSNHHLGRHRALGHLTSVSSLSSVISRSVRPATKASAVIAISGAMVASLALPASAATAAVINTDAKTTAPLAVPWKAQAPLAVPSIAQAPLVSRSFGMIGFTGVIKPPPTPAPVVVPVPRVVAAPVIERKVERVSRSTTRTPLSSPMKQVPAPAPRAPAPSAPAPSAPASRSGGVLGIAPSLNGIFYVYGGTTRAGFDCSGFTQYVFDKVGISLPRTAEAQRQFATKVSNPQPGDLVFFGAPAYHVGIYAGNGMMWDSPRTGKAVSKRAVYSPSVTYGRV